MAVWPKITDLQATEMLVGFHPPPQHPIGQGGWHAFEQEQNLRGSIENFSVLFSMSSPKRANVPVKPPKICSSKACHFVRSLQLDQLPHPPTTITTTTTTIMSESYTKWPRLKNTLLWALASVHVSRPPRRKRDRKPPQLPGENNTIIRVHRLVHYWWSCFSAASLKKAPLNNLSPWRRVSSQCARTLHEYQINMLNKGGIHH